MDLLFEIVLANFNRMKWFSNLNWFENYKNKFGLNENRIEQHQIRRCGFGDQIKW
jgi:hypothetical protein